MSKPKVYKIDRPYPETGALLKKAREEGNFSQREVSQHLKYSAAQFISNFERGIQAPPIGKLAKLLKFLRVNLDDFMKVYGREELARQKSDILAARTK